MIDFETYEVDAWKEDGLAMPFVQRARPSAPKRTSRFRTIILLPVVAASALMFYSVAPMAQFFTETPPRIDRAGWSHDIVPGAPSRFWAASIASIKNAPTIEESGPADPPTRY
jgi:hypothetical protein